MESISALFIMPMFDTGVLGDMDLVMKYCDIKIGWDLKKNG